MIVGIVGLGLIGGSLVKAYKRSGHKVYAYDIDEKMLEFAKLENNVDETLVPENISQCDLILIALYPIAAIDYLNKNAEYINKNAVVIDCCGTKKLICECGFANAKKYGFSFFRFFYRSIGQSYDIYSRKSCVHICFNSNNISVKAEKCG